MSFTIGADPEIIILDKASKKPVSMIGTIFGTKDNPQQILGQPGYALQHDGVLLEYNIPVCHSKEEFTGAINAVMTFIQKVILEPGDLQMSTETQGEYSENCLMDPKACEIGCDESFSIYGEGNETPDTYLDNFRYAGGHIHLGSPGMTEEQARLIISLCDIHLGVPSILVEPKNSRRELYGKAGNYRFDEGIKVEYRTLSNFWLFSKDAIEWIYTQSSFIMNNLDELSSQCTLPVLKAAQQIINSGDRKKAELFCKNLNVTTL